MGSEPGSHEGSLSVLIVEDHALVREATLRLVESLGYRPVAVATTGAALAVLERGHFDILLSDVVLGPGPDGIELSERASAASPALAVLLMSAFSSVHARMTDLPGHYRFIQKPCDPVELATLLRAAVDASRAAASSRDG